MSKSGKKKRSTAGLILDVILTLKMEILGITLKSQEIKAKNMVLLRQHILQSSLPASRMQIQPFQMMA